MADSLEVMDEGEVQRHVNAIYHAEGADKADYLYGIRSVPYDTPEEARRIAGNTVRNNYARWQRAGKKEPYLLFLRNRYAPLEAGNDPLGLNSNWLKNVGYFLENPKDVV